MPKKSAHKRKRGKKLAAHHFHPTTGGHHDRLRKAEHGHHPHPRKRAKSHAHSASAAEAPRKHHHKRAKSHAHSASAAEPPRKHHHKRRSMKRASIDRRVTEQTLRDHMALNCVRRCAH